MRYGMAELKVLAVNTPQTVMVATTSACILLATVPNGWVGSGSGSEPEPNHCNGSYHTITRTIAIGPVLLPNTRHFNITRLAPIDYLSSDRIVTWLLCKLCRFTRSFASCFQISNPTNIRWVAIENPRFSLHIWPYFTAIQRMLVWLQIWKRKVKERIKLHNLHIDHVTIQSELRYLIGAKVEPEVERTEKSNHSAVPPPPKNPRVYVQSE